MSNVVTENETEEYFLETEYVPRAALFGHEHLEYLDPAVEIERAVHRSILTPDVPKYVFDPVENVVTYGCIASNTPFMLTGGYGSGKSDHFRAFADRLNMDLIPISCRKDMDSDGFFGKVGLRTIKTEDGTTHTETYWEDGIFTAAIRNNGRPKWVLLDEVDRLDSGLAKSLNYYLETGQLLLDSNSDDLGNILIESHSMTRIFATSNTGGRIDMTGQYASDENLDASFLSRFVHRIKSYPSFDVEKEIVNEKIDGLEDEHIDDLIKFAQLTRESHMNHDLDYPMSTRQVIRAAEWMVMMSEIPAEIAPDGAVRLALELNYLEGLGEEDKAVAESLYSDVY